MTPPRDLRTAGPEALAQAMREQRASTLLALEGMDPGRWVGSCIATVNPPLWEIGHIAWFQERWCVREPDSGTGPDRKSGADSLPAPSIQANADVLYPSNLVEHTTRWQIALLEPEVVFGYLEDVQRLALQRLQAFESSSPDLYFQRLALFHEMMHRESFCHSWQTLGYSCPKDLPDPKPLGPQAWMGVPAGTVRLGSDPNSGFVFDNEKWAAPCELEGFEIAKRVVSSGEFAEFVEADGYRRPEFWPPDIYKQLQVAGRTTPRYWRRQKGGFQVRRFDRWEELVDAAPLTHVTLYEAQAYARWAGCRLPTEAQWLHAAQQPGFEWGAVWEWTASEFAPFPGFHADPYEEYSAPWFHTHQVLKGASFATPSGLWDLRFRNFYEPERDDVFNGFRILRSESSQRGT